VSVGQRIEFNTCKCTM